MRMTKHRKVIYDILQSHSDDLLDVESILDMVKEDAIDQSTVYRALEVFHAEGIVSKSVLDNKAYYYLNSSEHHHFMICTKCHKKFTIPCHLDLSFISKYAKDFTPTQHDLTIYGLCKTCKSA